MHHWRSQHHSQRLPKTMCMYLPNPDGYRLAPKIKYHVVFEDDVEALSYLAKQANLAECTISGRVNLRRRQIVNGFGSFMIKPWIVAHVDLSRYVLLGVSCSSNIANYVTQKAVEPGNLLDPLRVVAQVLIYHFVIGNTPTKSEIKLGNSYLYDRSMAMFAWKLFLSDDQFNSDHTAANPLMKATRIPLQQMPPTLTKQEREPLVANLLQHSPLKIPRSGAVFVLLEFLSLNKRLFVALLRSKICSHHHLLIRVFSTERYY
ncbi:unnamed protein product [Lactuca saligna]|uniref:Alpha/beta hydrolase fold-3 domain-containing protein n=1 Tax=Lactuca saligna TaxID=75948 RepID=A0AA35ZGE3_LACSI|nr:unnamed protein product [Lactuca saligna]